MVSRTEKEMIQILSLTVEVGCLAAGKLVRPEVDCPMTSACADLDAHVIMTALTPVVRRSFIGGLALQKLPY